jgi:hypothetical protein
MSKVKNSLSFSSRSSLPMKTRKVVLELLKLQLCWSGGINHHAIGLFPVAKASTPRRGGLFNAQLTSHSAKSFDNTVLAGGIAFYSP